MPREVLPLRKLFVAVGTLATYRVVPPLPELVRTPDLLQMDPSRLVFPTSFHRVAGGDRMGK
jgi:hypothetical protein